MSMIKEKTDNLHILTELKNLNNDLFEYFLIALQFI